MPELGSMGRDVLTIVILTLHLLWRELIICEITSLITSPSLYLPSGTICVELVLTNGLYRVNPAHIYVIILRPTIVGKFEQTNLKE